MKIWKVFVSLGVIILVAGISVFIAGLAAGGWKFGSDFEMRTFTAQEENSSLDLSLAAGKMNVQFYEGENIEVEYPSAYPYRYEVKESGGNLTVKPAYNGISFGWFPWFKYPTVTVKVPQNKALNLKLSVSAGTATVDDGDFGSLNLSLSAGYVSVGSVNCSLFVAHASAGSLNVSNLNCGNIKVDLSAGSANLTVKGKKSDYYITVDKSAGSCNVGEQQGAVAGKVIDIDLSAGSVDVNFTD